MTTTVKGFCEKAYRNPKNGLCSLLIKDDSGNETWYSTYKTLYENAAGKTVEIQAVQKGKFWNCNGEPKILAGPPETPAAQAAYAGYDARQSSIVLQSSYKTASDLVGYMAGASILTLPTKKADQYDAFLNYVDEVALRIYRNCINPQPFVTPEDVEGDDPAPADWNPVEA